MWLSGDEGLALGQGELRRALVEGKHTISQHRSKTSHVARRTISGRRAQERSTCTAAGR